MMAQAFALRALARRYPRADEQALTPADRDLLARLRQSYEHELDVRFQQLAGLLAPLLSAAPTPPAIASTWQQGAEQAFTSVQRLDSMLSEVLAGPPRGSPSRDELLRQLGAVNRAQTAVRGIE